MEVVREIMDISKLRTIMSLPWKRETMQVEVIVMPIAEVSRKISNDDFYKLSGAWESEKTAEEIITELKSARK